MIIFLNDQTGTQANWTSSRGWSVLVFLRKPIATCDFRGGPEPPANPPPPSGSNHVSLRGKRHGNANTRPLTGSFGNSILSFIEYSVHKNEGRKVYPLRPAIAQTPYSQYRLPLLGSILLAVKKTKPQNGQNKM